MKTLIVTFLTFFILTTSSFSQSNASSKHFKLQGKITGQDSGSIILKYYENGKYIQDTATIKKGKFVFEGNIVEPLKAQILGGDDLNSTALYLDSGVIKVNLTKDKFDKREVTGSITQNESDELNRLQEPVISKIIILKEQLILMRDSIRNSKEEALLKKLKKDYEDKDNQDGKLRDLVKANKIGFILSHPQSFLSSELLDRIITNSDIPLDSSKTLYSSLDQLVQNSPSGKEIKKIIIEKEKSAVGAIAPDFKTIDLNNQPLTLSEFQGKNEVLLVFWASWCVPCRGSFPHLKEIYKKYHLKGLEIILVSVDDDKEKWVTAVNQDSIGMWHQIHYSGSFVKDKRIAGNIREQYYVFGVPDDILIDKKGIIIARPTDGMDEIDKKLAEIF